jgi:hypothetical protein
MNILYTAREKIFPLTQSYSRSWNIIQNDRGGGNTRYGYYYGTSNIINGELNDNAYEYLAGSNTYTTQYEATSPVITSNSSYSTEAIGNTNANVIGNGSGGEMLHFIIKNNGNTLGYDLPGGNRYVTANYSREGTCETQIITTQTRTTTAPIYISTFSTYDNAGTISTKYTVITGNKRTYDLTTTMTTLKKTTSTIDQSYESYVGQKDIGTIYSLDKTEVGIKLKNGIGTGTFYLSDIIETFSQTTIFQNYEVRPRIPSSGYPIVTNEYENQSYVVGYGSVNYGEGSETTTTYINELYWLPPKTGSQFAVKYGNDTISETSSTVNNFISHVYGNHDVQSEFHISIAETIITTVVNKNGIRDTSLIKIPLPVLTTRVIDVAKDGLMFYTTSEGYGTTFIGGGNYYVHTRTSIKYLNSEPISYFEPVYKSSGVCLISNKGDGVAFPYTIYYPFYSSIYKNVIDIVTYSSISVATSNTNWRYRWSGNNLSWSSYSTTSTTYMAGGSTFSSKLYTSNSGEGAAIVTGSAKTQIEYGIGFDELAPEKFLIGGTPEYTKGVISGVIAPGAYRITYFNNQGSYTAKQNYDHYEVLTLGDKQCIISPIQKVYVLTVTGYGDSYFYNNPILNVIPKALH